MLKIGSEVKGYIIHAISNMTVLASSSSPTCPEKYVVWDLDYDGEGVNTGRYFTTIDEALEKFNKLVSQRTGGSI
ncbi:MAG: hypothetical protein ACI4KO_09855 [Ruminiclostridium sp.]